MDPNISWPLLEPVKYRENQLKARTGPQRLPASTRAVPERASSRREQQQPISRLSSMEVVYIRACDT